MKEKQEVITDEANDPFWPDKKDFFNKAEHLARYYFVVDFIKKTFPNSRIETVYDMASGLGFGVKILSEICDRVCAFDLNQEYISYSKKHYHTNNSQYFTLDLDKDSIKQYMSQQKLSTPQIVTSFETIEHLEFPNFFVKNVSEILDTGSYFICSVPNEAYEPKTEEGKPMLKYHKQLFTKQDFINLLENNNFKVIQFLGQPIPNIMYNYFKPLLKIIDYIFLRNNTTLEFFSKKLGYPGKHLNKFTYSFVAIARKRCKASLYGKI